MRWCGHHAFSGLRADSVAKQRGFFPGGRDNPHATAQPQSPRTPATGKSDRSSSNAFPPVPQRSLMREVSPPDGPLTRRTVSGEGRTSEKWASPADVSANKDQDFGVDPEAFEAGAHASRLRRHAGSPDLRRVSMDSQRATPGSEQKKKGSRAS